MTLKISHEQASRNILKFVDEDRLIQGEWHGRSAKGRHTACLLGAMDKRVSEVSDCNGDLMPLWLAELTPRLFDGLPPAAMYPIARRYGGLVAQWHVLSPEQWEGIKTQFLIKVIDLAMDAARPAAKDKSYWGAIEAAVKQVKETLLSGGEAARAAACAAARAAADVARAAANASDAATFADAAYAVARGEPIQRLFTYLLDGIEHELA